MILFCVGFVHSSVLSFETFQSIKKKFIQDYGLYERTNIKRAV